MLIYKTGFYYKRFEVTYIELDFISVNNRIVSPYKEWLIYYVFS